MTEQTHWRLAVMFDAPGGDLATLEANLKQAGDAIRAAAQGNHVRLGVADHHPEISGPTDTHDTAGWRTVDGALEITLPNEQMQAIPAICRALRPVIEGMADISTIEVMAGPMFPMVPMREGETFLSLAFRRDPSTTSQQFRDWWLNQHAGIAIPVINPGLLAYDQVHVDMDATAAAAQAFGVPVVEYDAYDNLTWDGRSGYLRSSAGDPDGMATIAEDEVGRIDNSSRRFSIMTEI